MNKMFASSTVIPITFGTVDILKSDNGISPIYSITVLPLDVYKRQRQCRILRTVERKFALDFAAAVYYQLLFIQIITLS